MELDISIRRPLMRLYWRGVLSTDAKHVQREFRAGFLQSCLVIANYQDLFGPQYSELDVPRSQGYWDFFYTCYRQELGQAIFGMCLEIKNLTPLHRQQALAQPHARASRRAQARKGPHTQRKSDQFRQGHIATNETPSTVSCFEGQGCRL